MLTVIILVIITISRRHASLSQEVGIQCSTKALLGPEPNSVRGAEIARRRQLKLSLRKQSLAVRQVAALAFAGKRDWEEA
jgi:hypothetical protein